MVNRRGEAEEAVEIDVHDLPDMYAQAGHWVRRAHQVHNALWASQVSATVTPSQFAVLSALAARPDADQNALARATSLDTSTIGAIVNRLTQRGWIDVSKDPSDLRRNLLALSDEGRAEFEAIAHRAATMTDSFVEPLRPAEKAQLVRILRRLVEAGEPS